MYQVQIKPNRLWITLSKHRNQLYADANAETTAKSRKCEARVKYKGKVITFYRGK